jgi:hypothetical protein
VKGETSLNPLSLSLSNPRLPGTSPLGLASLNRKDLPIVVTLGGVGPCYASLAFYFIAFAPSYKLCDNNLLSRTNTMDPPSWIRLLERFAQNPQKKREQVLNHLNEDVIKEQSPEQDDEVSTRAPPSDEVI